MLGNARQVLGKAPRTFGKARRVRGYASGAGGCVTGLILGVRYSLRTLASFTSETFTPIAPRLLNGASQPHQFVTQAPVELVEGGLTGVDPAARLGVARRGLR